MPSVADIARRSIGVDLTHDTYMGEHGPEIFSLLTGSYSSITGTHQQLEDAQLDKLLGRLMVHTQKVILPCKWCGSHNAFSNSNCVKCGGPLG